MRWLCCASHRLGLKSATPGCCCLFLENSSSAPPGGEGSSWVVAAAVSLSLLLLFWKEVTRQPPDQKWSWSDANKTKKNRKTLSSRTVFPKSVRQGNRTHALHYGRIVSGYNHWRSSLFWCFLTVIPHIVSSHLSKKHKCTKVWIWDTTHGKSSPGLQVGNFGFRSVQEYLDQISVVKAKKWLQYSEGYYVSTLWHPASYF